jgi:hypothetical protein
MANFIIAKDTAYADDGAAGTVTDFDDLQSLSEGSIVVLDDENNVLNGSTVAADVAKGQYFQVIYKGAGGELIKSPAIPFDCHHQMSRVPVTAVKQAIVLGEHTGGSGDTNLPSLTVGAVAEIVVVERDNRGFQVGNVYRYNRVVVTGDDEESILDALIAKINADEDAIVTAAAVTNTTTVGIILTAIDNKTIFSVRGEEILENATITEDGTNGSALHVYGKGDVDELTALYNESNIQDGKAYSAGQQHFWWKRENAVPASGAFVLWTFEWSTVSRTGVADIFPNSQQKAFFAAPHNASNSVDDTFAAIMAAVLKSPTNMSGFSATTIDDAAGTPSGA